MAAATTTLGLVQYYAGLLVKQYVTKPKAVATMEASATPILMPQTSVQTITFDPAPTSGAFVLTYDDDVNDITINWNDSAATIQTKLRGLAPDNLSGGNATTVFSQILSGGDASRTLFQNLLNGGSAYGFDLAGLTVTGSIASGTLSVTLTGVFPPAALLELVSSTLMASGTPVTITITETDLTLPLAVKNGYQITGDNPAVGAQLDVIGKYVGVVRTVNGFAQQFTLDDADFLSLIKMAIILNNARSDLGTIQGLLWQFFPGGQILVFDYADMSMSFMIAESIGSFNLVQAFVAEGLLPVPMAVGFSVIYAPTINNFFGCVTYEQPVAVNNSPCNTYQSYLTGRPCMDYSYGVVLP